MDYILYISAALIIWNAATFILYGADKRKAKKDKWRTKESTLILCAFLMGGIGAFLGMKVFRHKTKHLKFKLLVPISVVVNAGVIVCGLFLALK